MSLTPDTAARAALAQSANTASRVQGLAGRASGGQGGAAPPAKAFGKILDGLTPEKAETAGMSPEAVKTLQSQAMNKRFSPGPSEEKKLQEACEGFEAVFIGQLLKEMRKTVPKDGLLTSKYEEQYVSMFDEELSKTLTRQGGIGLTSFMKQQLAARASGKDQAPAPQEGGLRMSAQERQAFPLGGKAARGLRDSGLKPLKGPGAPAGPDVILAADAVRPGSLTGPNAPVSMHSHQPPAGSIAGTPSQHAGLPGANYLTGKDALLAAQPLEGEVTSEFGWRKDPFTGRRAWHGGMDIAAPEGTPIRATRDGIVSFAGRKGGYGNLVVVDHGGGVSSYYGHNKANNVAEGQAVRAGQVIAQVGQTGRATGPHLHFEVRVDGGAVDPAGLGRSMLAAAPDPKTMVPEL